MKNLYNSSIRHNVPFNLSTALIVMMLAWFSGCGTLSTCSCPVPGKTATLSPEQTMKDEATEFLKKECLTWNDVPQLIKYRNELPSSYVRGELAEKLFCITHVERYSYFDSFNFTSNPNYEYFRQRSAEQWNEWWEKTGNVYHARRKTEAQIDEEAWGKLLDLLMPESTHRPTVPKEGVYVPPTWSLHCKVWNGDYHAKIRETWTIVRDGSGARLYRHYSNITAEGARLFWGEAEVAETLWQTAFEAWDELSGEEADTLLRVLIYAIEEELPKLPERKKPVVPGRKGKRFWYYPHGTVKLTGEDEEVFWHFQGYSFTLDSLGSLWGEFETSYWQRRSFAGRIYFVLTQMFPDGDGWRTLSEPDTEQMRLLLKEIAAFAPNEYDIALVEYLMEHGGTRAIPVLKTVLERCNRIKEKGPSLDELVGSFGYIESDKQMRRWASGMVDLSHTAIKIIERRLLERQQFNNIPPDATSANEDGEE